MRKLTIIIISTVLFISCKKHEPFFEGEPFEKYTSLNDPRFSKQKLDSLKTFIKNNLETSGMIILKDGKTVFEYGDLTETGYIASCRKSVLSLLYGKYVENGTIDLNETLREMGVDEDKGLLKIEKTATVKNIITSRSGVFYEPVNGGYDIDNILERGSVKPGEYFVYNNWDFNVAGYIFERKTGKNIYSDMEDQLAIPLGFQDWNIKNQKKKYNNKKSKFPAYHMYISTRDMAKVGQLMLNNGKWKGKQLVSKDWINTITTPFTSTQTVNARYGRNDSSPYQFSYGYMWWIIDNFKNHPDFEGAYSTEGYGGQFLIVIPKLKIVVAHKYAVRPLVSLGIKKGGVSNNSFWTLIYDFVKTEGS